MGVYNMAAALRVAPDKLAPAPRVTLLVMALLTFDVPTAGQPPRVYYGGWKLACMYMGLLPSEDMRRRFVRDIAALRDCGIVEVLEPGRRGHTAVYRLLLPVDNPPDSVDTD